MLCVCTFTQTCSKGVHEKGSQLHAPARALANLTGGRTPRWSHDGRKLFYVEGQLGDAVSRLMEASVEEGSVFRPVDPDRCSICTPGLRFPTPSLPVVSGFS